jgi:hypothetical protein
VDAAASRVTSAPAAAAAAASSKADGFSMLCAHAKRRITKQKRNVVAKWSLLLTIDAIDQTNNVCGQQQHRGD